MTVMLLLLIGCTDKDGDGTDSATDTGASFTPAPEYTYPTGDEILVYTGHGGADGAGGVGGAVETISAHWLSTYGWETRVKDSIPSDLSKYRAIIMMAPGSSDLENFSASNAEQFSEALRIGTRLVILADNGTCSNTAVSNLLDLMGVSIRFTGEAADANMVVSVDAFNFDNQITTGLTELRLHDPCYADAGGGEMLFADEDNNIVGVAERPGFGGDIALIGDMRFLDDTGYLDYVDNLQLADNLVTIEP